MPSPRRTQGIETHNASADDAGIGDMPPRKRTTPRTQPACAGNPRLVPDAAFLPPYGHDTITRDEWIPPSGDITFSEQLANKTRNVGLQFVVGRTIHEFRNPTRSYSIGLIEVTAQYLKRLLSFLFAKDEIEVF
jgi:hypothetical protein